MNVSAAERVADAVGPIVVKEVRQGLRAKVFAICFGLLLVACLTVALVAAAESNESVGSALGPRYLTLFLCGLGTVCFLVIPYLAYRSMAKEREDETWVLLVLTGLSSRRIVRGKIASALSQALLYSSACAPFMVLSYFLNGIDLPTLVLVVMLAACWSLFLVTVGVALGTEGRSRLGRAAVHFLVLGLLFAATVGGIAFGGNFAHHGSQWLEQDSFQIFLVAFPALLLTTSLLLIEGAAAGLSLTSESSVSGVRGMILVQQAIAIAATYLGVSLTAHAMTGVASIASILSSISLVLIGAFAISERDGFPRVSRGARTWLTGGAYRGFTLVVGLLVLDTIVWAALHRLIPNTRAAGLDHHERYSLFAAPLYVALYLCLAVIVGRLSPLRQLGEPVATRTAFAGLVVAAMVLFPVAAVIDRNRAESIGFNLLNPFFGMINFIERASESECRDGLKLLIGCCLVAVPWAWNVLRVRDRERNA